MTRRARTIGAALLVLAACAHRTPQTAPTAVPTMLIDSRGIVMPLREAVGKIGFRPYLPRDPVLAIAVIPPLGGADTTASRGIAVEYLSGRAHLVLSEWPRGSFDLSFGRKDITFDPCTPVAYAPNEYAWTTRTGLAMTLQPDGEPPASGILGEARRLIALGACR